jgi:hypothetical protein
MISDSVYKSEHGYFMLRQSGEWIFTPVEKEFDSYTLLGIVDTLWNFNEQNDED